MQRGLSILVLALFVGCGGGGSSASRTFDEELQLTLRAGRGELTETEKMRLLKENHPILAQVGDPKASKLVELFSKLPEEERRRLVVDSYVKWRMSEFDPETQGLYRELIQVVMQLRTGVQSPFETVTEPIARQQLIESTEIGFAVVELEKTQEKVVSWYALGPQLEAPLWVTIVNSDAAGTDDYIKAHLVRLPMLRAMRHTAAPRIFKLPHLITSMV
jgi:hypothetical protein